jgi:redox-sensing transcriptional repressor
LPRFGKLTLERLMRYHRFLSDALVRHPSETTTSARIAEALDIDATQVRKDFAAIDVIGVGRVGYDTCETCRAIRVALGFDQEYEGIIIGAGHLGSALIAYGGFAPYGLRIVAAFDTDQRKVGRKAARLTVRPMTGMSAYIKRRKTRLAILTTPAAVSQKLADRVIRAGVEAIWNFSPTELTVPEGVFVRNEHISRGLSEIAYHLKHSGAIPHPSRNGEQ